MKKKIIVKNISGLINFICDEKICYYELISEIRNRLSIIRNKTNEKIKIVLWLGNRKTDDLENLEILENFSKYNLDVIKV